MQLLICVKKIRFVRFSDSGKAILSIPQRNNQLIVSSTMNQISSSSHQGPQQHRSTSPQVYVDICIKTKRVNKLRNSSNTTH